MSLKQHPWQGLKSFIKTMFNKFYEILKNTVDENKTDATTIFHIGETVLSTIQNKCQKVIAEKGI